MLERTLDGWLEPIGGLDADDELRLYVGRELEMSQPFPEASPVFAPEMPEGASVLSPHLSGRARAKALAFAQIVDGWIAAEKFRPHPIHLLFFIWSATQHYADFAAQVRAVLDVRQLGRAQFAEAEETLLKILLSWLSGPRTELTALNNHVIS